MVRQRKEFGKTLLLATGLSALAGAALGLFAAPKSGKENRDEAAHTVTSWWQQVENFVNDNLNFLRSKAQQAKARQTQGDVQEGFEHVGNLAKEKFQELKDRAAEKSHRLDAETKK